MSPERAELERLVHEPPQDQVPIVLADVRRRLSSGLDRPWPPAYFAGARPATAAAWPTCSARSSVGNA